MALRPSRSAAAAVALMAAATLALIAATPGPLGARILAGTWVACLALHALRPNRLRSLRLERSGEIEVDGRAGTLRPGSFVAPWLTVIRWRPRRARFDRTVLVLPDMLPPETFRELRVLLKWS